jgi:uncharacterized protein involved in exopolysaccharide biosynthesis
MNPMNNDADGAAVLRFLFRYRVTYLSILILAILCGIGISLLMKPKYHSYAILFPVQNSSIESVVDNPVFGYDVEADRLLQVLYSEEVFDSCATKFHLYEFMGIDSTRSDSRDKLKERFHDAVSFTRSQYVSIVISADMTDPQLSADMVNYIIQVTDGIRNRIYKKNLYIVYQSLEKEYTERRNHLDRLTDSVTALRGATTVEVFGLLSNQVVLKNNNQSSSKEQTSLERLLNNYLFEQTQINDLSERYRRAKTQYERPVTQLFVLQYAKPSYLKRSPNYVVNTVICIACALVFLTGFLLLRDKIRSVQFRD